MDCVRLILAPLGALLLVSGSALAQPSAPSPSPSPRKPPRFTPARIEWPAALRPIPPKSRVLSRPRPLPKRRSTPSEEGVVDDPYTSVVVAGVRPDTLLDTPRSVEVLDHRHILRLAPRSTPELLSDVPGVLVQKSNHGGGSPFIRGFTGQHVLHLLDGVRINNSTTRYGPNQALNTVDPFTLRRVEVLRGPGSVLYGSDAVGGVIYLISRDAPYVPGAGLRWGGEATARYGSADMSQTYNLGAWTQTKRLTIFLGGSYKWFNSLVGGRGIGKQDWTGYSEGDFDAKARLQLGRHWSVQLATSGVRQRDVPRTDSCTPTDFRYYRVQDRDLIYAKLSGRHGRGLDRFVARVSFQSHREERERFRLDQDRMEYERDRVHTVGLSVVAGSDLGKVSRLTYGLDLYYDWVGSFGEHEALSTGVVTGMSAGGFRGRFVDGSRYVQGGLFITDRLEPLPWLTITAGGRFAVSHASVPTDPLGQVYGFDGRPLSATFLGPAGGASLTFIPWKPLHLIASVQHAYRAPNLDDTSHVGSETLGFDVPSPDLKKAEQATTFEVGVKLALRRLTLSAFGHYSLLRDFIARHYTGDIVDGQPATIRVNAGAGYMAGLEAQATVRLPKGFYAAAWVSWTRGEIKLPLPEPQTQPIRRVPPLQGQLSAGYRANRYWATLSLRWSTRQRRLSPGDLNDSRISPDGPDGCRGTPGFAVLSVAGGLTLRKGLDLILRLHNVSNEPYKYHGSGVYQPGTSVTAELRLAL